jgi:serine/threonine-protein kinase 24/25/MST4
MERIGRGTFAEVYRATEDSGLVAVKIIPLDGLGSDIEEIQQEIRLLSRCDHPNIIKYKRTIVDKNRLWIVMDYCELGSIRNIIVTRTGNNCNRSKWDRFRKKQPRLSAERF